MTKKIKEYLTKVKLNYNDEKYFENIELKYSNWLENVNSEFDKEILNKIFYNLEFYSKKDMKKMLEKIINSIGKEYDLENVTFMPIKSRNGRYNSSYDMLYLIKEIEREKQIEGDSLLPYENSIVTDLSSAKKFETIVFIDDISGTGGTIKKFIEDNYRELEGKYVVFLLLTVSEKAIDVFENLSSKNEKYNFIYCVKQDTLSKKKILSEEEYNRLYSIEKHFWTGITRNILGFEQSELLTLFSHNIPNNTLSSFWFDSEIFKKDSQWNRLFARITSSPKKKQRKRQNYNNTKRR